MKLKTTQHERMSRGSKCLEFVSAFDPETVISDALYVALTEAHSAVSSPSFRLQPAWGCPANARQHVVAML